MQRRTTLRADFWLFAVWEKCFAHDHEIIQLISQKSYRKSQNCTMAKNKRKIPYAQSQRTYHCSKKRIIFMNKQQLANKLWASANDLRGKMDASEYKNYILGFLFYKFLSEHQEKHLHKEYQITTKEVDASDIATIQEDLGYFIFEADLYATWVENIKNKNWKISAVTDALSHFRENINDSQRDDFEGIFEDVNLTSEKLGSNPAEKETAIRRLIMLLNEINISDSNREYDTFGFIYEYLIAQFAMASGKKAGEFYTPHEVSRIMAMIVANELRHKEHCTVYDPTAGSGSLLFAVGDETNHSKHHHNIKYYGQENNSTTYNIARMNLLMRGVTPANMVLRNADTLKEDWPNGIISGKNDPLFVDCVVANPPYSAKWDNANGQLKDPRFRDYGLAPATKADYAFLLHSLYHLKQDGIMAIVLPHGVLFRGNEEEKIRTALLKRGQIDAVIGLPAGIFTNTGIPTIILVLRKTTQYNNVLFIDASQGFRKEKNSNILRERDIKKILDVYLNRAELDGFSHIASLTEIEQNQFNLNIPRYITPINQTESQNIDAHLKGGIPEQDIAHFDRFWQAFPALKEKLFRPLRPKFVSLNVEPDDIFNCISQDPDYQAFITQMHANIEQWQQNVKNLLLAETALDSEQILLSFQQLEQQLFGYFEQSHFTDPYEAYQLFVDSWRNQIQPDLELIAEHDLDFSYAKALQPNMIIKSGKEVQDGNEGVLLPNSLIAEAFFNDDVTLCAELKNQITQQEEPLQTAQDELQSAVENEEDLTALSDIIKTAKSNANKAKTALLDLLGEEDASDKFALLKSIEQTSQQIKSLKSTLKEKEPALDIKVEQRYQTLTVTEIKTLLAQKWLTRLVADLENITHSHSRQLAQRLKTLHLRYAETLQAIQQQRQQSEAAFWALAQQLIGE